MWPFSSSTPKPSDSLSSSNDLLVTPPLAIAPTVPSSDPTLLANPLPATGRPPAPGFSSPTAELAAQDAEHRPTRADLGVVVPLSKGSALDSTSMLIVGAGVLIAVTGPSALKLPPKAPSRLGLVLGTWSLTTFALVRHLAEKFKDQEFEQWEKTRALEPSTSSAPRSSEFESGFGGQESLKDKYATTSGDH